MRDALRAAGLGIGLLAAATAAAGEPGDYLADVKPVLERRCYACHGALQQKAGLRLDTAAAIRRGGEGGAAIEPGRPEESYLLEVLDGTAGITMPPDGPPLAAEQVESIRSWVAAGAPAPAVETPQADPRAHWAFRPPVRPPVPAMAGIASRHPIDAFLEAERRARGLETRPEADRATLLRRVSLDLTGLAPTPEELHAFEADERPDAYDRAVDRLLASPAYGERWGRHWMDVWRYSDWAGYQKEVRESQPHVWRWRDWIVESLNADRPYDQMIREMLAGDELAPGDPATLRATGYLVRSWSKFNRNIWLQNTVDHAAKGFLGLTLACARCHDHKYDPIEQADYYRFRAFFEAEEIATDRVPGQPDTALDGVARVYDVAEPKPTYLFRRGDEKSPETDRPMPPEPPKVFGYEVPIEPVALAAEAYAPGLRPHVRAESRAAAEAAVAKARTQLTEARAKADERREQAVAQAGRLETPAAKREQALADADAASAAATLAGKRLAAALTARAALEARIAADDARFATPADAARAETAARQAVHAERLASLLAAQAGDLEAEQALADARREAEAKPEDEKAKKAVAAAEAKRGEAAKGLDAAHKAVAEAPGTAYTPLAPVRPATSTGQRLALARWITDRRNPLTARVAVNHVWMRHHGRPLVETVFDFGLNGKAPSHPALLDWLAVELVESGWSLKHLHRLIVTTTAYRMESWGRPDDPNARIDPQNAYLWRMNPRRLEAELVRDNVLAAAGSLDRSLGGPEQDHEAGLGTPRRSLYFRHAHEKQVLFLKLFDAASATACYRRDVSVVPQQALALVNSPLTLAEARRLAASLVEGIEETVADAAFVDAAFERVLGRRPESSERDACLAFLSEQAQRLAATGQLSAFEGGAEAPIGPSKDPRQRAREDLVHALFNHTDFVTIR